MSNLNLMKLEQFKKIIDDRLERTKKLLLIKGMEYMRNKNPFHNFDEGAKTTNQSPTRVLDGFLLKHIISYRDILNDIDKGIYPKSETIDEKLGDIILYFSIQEALIKREIEKPKLNQ